MNRCSNMSVAHPWIDLGQSPLERLPPLFRRLANYLGSLGFLRIVPVMAGVDDSYVAEQFRVHGPAVYRRALRLLGNPEDSEEVLQDVFVRLATHADGFDPDQPALNWLYRVTTRRCLDLISARKRRTELLELNYHPETKTEWVPENALILQDVLGACKPEEQQAAIHAYCDGMAHHEIAEVLGVSRRTVGNLLQRVQDRAKKLSTRSTLVGDRG